MGGLDLIYINFKSYFNKSNYPIIKVKKTIRKSKFTKKIHFTSVSKTIHSKLNLKSWTL